MAQKYDIMNGGLDQLIQDLNSYEQKLLDGNKQIVRELTSIALNSIQSYGQNVIDSDERSDVVNNNNVYLTDIGDVSIGLIINDGKQTAYAEYGYGIVGSKAPYGHFDLWGGEEAAGYEEGYDVDSSHKSKKDRSWIYRDRRGMLSSRTRGSVSVPTFYMSFMETLISAEQITMKVLGGIFK